MKATIATFAGLLFALGGVALIAGGVSMAAPTATSSASAGSSASASAPAAPLTGAEVPTDPSKRPEAKEWGAARSVAINRGEPRRCRALLLREWLRVECTDYVAVTLVAGDPKDVRTVVRGYPGAYDEATKADTHSLAIFETPVRRGRSVIATFLSTSIGEGIAFDAEGPIFELTWRDGSPDPILILSEPMTRRPE